jgi:peptide/nickel transport system permease protein
MSQSILGSAASIRRIPRAWLLCALALVAFSAVAVFPLGVAGTDVNPVIRLRPPSLAHWFGTDQLGRDLFLLCIEGGRISLMIGASVAALALAVGTLLGLLALRSRVLDLLLMRLADGLMAIPSILIAIGLVSVFGSSIPILIVAISVPEIPRIMRLLRSALLPLRESDFVEAARMSGCGWAGVIFVHLFPIAIPVLAVQGTYTMANAILVESGLSFLGLGVPGDTPSWGGIIAEGKLYFQLFPYQVLIPGALLAFSIYLINLLGDWLRERLDPRLQPATP